MSKILGSTAVITGAASGFGRLIANMLAEKGANLVLVDINIQGLEETQKECKKHGTDIITVQADLSNREQCIKAAEEIKQKTEKIDILINNAGIVTGKTLLESDYEEIEKSFAVNTLSHFWLVKAFLPDMITRNSGHIVTISSAAGIIGVNRLADYCASKFAVFGFTEALRMELKAKKLNIKTTIIAPYYSSTGMFEGVSTKVPWMLPILKPETVAKKTVKAIEKNKNLVVIPPIARVVWLFRLLGTGVLDAMANLLGINNTMDHFKGRKNGR